MSLHGSRRWRTPEAFTYRAVPRTRCATRSQSKSRRAGSRTSKTSRGQSKYSASSAKAAKRLAAVVHKSETRVQTAAVGDKPTIAVLPFVNMSGEPEQEFFADGLTEDILTELSRFRDLFVISRNSAFVYKGKPVKVQKSPGSLASSTLSRAV